MKYRSETAAVKRLRHAHYYVSSCHRKVGYETKAEATQKGMQTYQCAWCGRWHRASRRS